MESNFDEPFEALENLFHMLIEDAPIPLQEYMYGTEKAKVNISAPMFLVTRMLEAMTIKYKFKPDYIFEGIKIIPSSDYALTLFHEDYPIYKEDWMIHKISLDPLFVSKPQSHITKYLGFIKEFIPKQISGDSSQN